MSPYTFLKKPELTHLPTLIQTVVLSYHISRQIEEDPREHYWEQRVSYQCTTECGILGLTDSEENIKRKWENLKFSMKRFDICCTTSTSYLNILIIHLLQQGGRAEEWFKLKNSGGTRTNGYQLAIKNLRLQFRRWFLIVRGRRSWNSFPNRGEDRKFSGCRTESDEIYNWDYRIWLPDPRNSCQFVTHFHCHCYNIHVKEAQAFMSFPVESC